MFESVNSDCQNTGLKLKNLFKGLPGKKQESQLYEPPWKVTTVDECNFYHSTDIPGVGLIEGKLSSASGR